MDLLLPLKVLSIDPAITKSGWAVLLVESLIPLRITILAHGQIDGDKLLRTRKEMLQTYQKQFCKLDALHEEYIRLLDTYKPDYVISEGAFGYKHLAALISLTLAINTLRRAAHQILNTDVIEIPPAITKKAFSGKGNADKDVMRQAYYDASYLTRSGANDISEHEIDAIAHGCAFVMRDLTKEIVQIHARDKSKDKKK